MKIYFLRHGDAVPTEEWSGAESERPLTAKGEKDMRLEGRRFAELGLEFSLALSSPYARALQTAALAISAMEKPPAIRVDERLKPGFGVDEFNDILSGLGELPSALLVGHEPDLSDTMAILIGGGRLDVKKGSLARIDIVPGENLATLGLLIPPAFLR
jgi:phosphohistidine phosphatase